ncbi:MAG: BfmA/BtgA family mobilization protein [Bacteroidota bacterium]
MENFSKYNFSGINFKKEVASRFREFSKQISKSNTEALESMLNFFDWNGISPNDNLDVKIDGTKKRINALIAIVKNIEKHQTKPTNAMLQTLFKEVSTAENNEEEEYDFGTPDLITENEELSHYRNEYFSTRENLNALKYDMEEIINKTTYVHGSFGGGYLKLDMTKEEFENLKQKLQDVYHHNTSEARE